MANKEIDISIGVDALIENGFFNLEEHKWKKAKEYFEKAQEVSPRNPYPYIGKLLVTHKLPTIDSLPDCPIDLRNTNNFKTALRYADENFKLQLESYAVQNKKKIELAQKEKELITAYEYERCIEKVEQPLSEGEYLKIYNTLSDMNYKESKRYADIFKAKYDEAKRNREAIEQKESIYNSAVSQMSSAKSAVDYLKIKEKLESISGYKDSNELIQQCDAKIKGKHIFLLLYKLFNKFWDNDSMVSIVTVATGLLFIPIFHNVLAFYVLSCLFAVGFSIGLNTKYYSHFPSFRRVFFVALIVVIIVTALFGPTVSELMRELFPPSSTDPDSPYCGICGGSGVFQNKICKYCGGWGIKD